jgi:hypothetical protein
MTDDFEPAEVPDELDADWRAALEQLRATARAGLPTEGQRSRVAAELAAIGEWVRLSAAPAARGAPVRGQGGQVRIRPDERQRAAPFHLFVDRALWVEIGEPQHVQLQAAGGALRILPAPRGEGQRVFTRAQTTIRIDCRKGEIGELETGDYAASVVDGTIVIGGVLGEVG